MTDVVKSDDVIIENLVYEFRGIQVMIDSELARLMNEIMGQR